MTTVKILILSGSLLLTGCPAWFPGESSSTGAPTTSAGGSGGDGGSGGVGAAPTTTTGSGGTIGCLLSQCPEPAECTAAACVDDACAAVLLGEDTPCGFAGTCDGAGHCFGLVDPLTCAEPCIDAGECGKGFCDPYTGTCSVLNLDNQTTCDGGDGHCKASDGTCCHGWQLPSDPAACLVVCPFGTIPDYKLGLCL